MTASSIGVIARRPLTGNMLDLLQTIAGYDGAATGGRSYVSPRELKLSLKNAARALRGHGLVDWGVNLRAYSLSGAGRVAAEVRL
ncbi:hypothetical protein ACVIGB_000735 [Bradyrhizobium sp. USDA 4341]